MGSEQQGRRVPTAERTAVVPMDLEAHRNQKGSLKTPLPCRGDCSLPSEVKEVVTVLSSCRWFSKPESPL